MSDRTGIPVKPFVFFLSISPPTIRGVLGNSDKTLNGLGFDSVLCGSGSNGLALLTIVSGLHRNLGTILGNARTNIQNDAVFM